MMLLNRESVGDKIFCYAMHTSRRILQCTLNGCKFRKGSTTAKTHLNQPGSAIRRTTDVRLERTSIYASGQKET